MKKFSTLLILLLTVLISNAQDAPDINAIDANGHTQLTAAVVLGDKLKVGQLLGQGASPDAKNGAGDLPITLAAKNKNNDIVNLLIAKQANQNATDNGGYIGLYYAVQQNNNIMVNAMLAAGASPNGKGVVETAIQNKNQPIMLALSTYKADFTPGLASAAQMNDAQLFRTILNFGVKCTNNTPFDRAVDNNNMEIAQMALENGANATQGLEYVMQKDRRNMLILCVSKGASADMAVSFAAQKNEPAIVTELVQKYNAKADIVLRESLASNNIVMAETALKLGADAGPHLDPAVMNKNAQLFDLLLRNKADATLGLKSCAIHDNLDLAKVAIQYGAQTTDTMLLGTAVRKNNLQMSQLMITGGAKVANQEMLKYPIANKNTELTALLLQNGASAMDPKFLTQAIDVNHAPVVEVLLQNGASATDGLRPAVNKNNEQLVKLMLQNGADATNPELMSVACGNASTNVVAALIDAGADPNNGMKNAITLSKDQTVDLLISRGASVNDPEYLALAAGRGNLKLFNTLLDKGAPTTYNSSANENLLHQSCKAGHYQITETLLKRGIDPNQKSTSGETPLHIAVNSARNDIELCQLLITNGADVKIRTGNGKTVVQMAKGKKLKKYLQSKGAPKK